VWGLGVPPREFPLQSNRDAPACLPARPPFAVTHITSVIASAGLPGAKQSRIHGGDSGLLRAGKTGARNDGKSPNVQLLNYSTEAMRKISVAAMPSALRTACSRPQFSIKPRASAGAAARSMAMSLSLVGLIRNRCGDRRRQRASRSHRHRAGAGTAPLLEQAGETVRRPRDRQAHSGRAASCRSR
jgi:hypothetical protein